MYKSTTNVVDACNLEEAMYLNRVIALEMILGIKLSSSLKSQLKTVPEREKIGAIVSQISDCAGLHSEPFGVNGESAILTWQKDDIDESKCILTSTYRETKGDLKEITRGVLSERPDLRRYFINHPLEDLLSRYLQFTDEPWNGKGIRDRGLTVKCNGFSEYDLEKRRLQLKAVVMAGTYLSASFTKKDANQIAEDSTIDSAVEELLTPDPRFPLVDIFTEEGKLSTLRCHDYQDFGNRGQLGFNYQVAISGRELVLNICMPSFSQRVIAEDTLRVFNNLFTKPSSTSMWDYVSDFKGTESSLDVITPKSEGEKNRHVEASNQSEWQDTPKF